MEWSRPVAGLGRSRRRGVSVPVLPPRIPTPVPPPGHRVSPPPPQSPYNSSHKAMKQLTHKYLDQHEEWINPRIFAKVNLSLVESQEYKCPQPAVGSHYRGKYRARPHGATPSLDSSTSAGTRVVSSSPRGSRAGVRDDMADTGDELGPASRKLSYEGQGHHRAGKRYTSQRPLDLGLYSEQQFSYNVSGLPGSPVQPSAAAAFFARAAQKLNLSSPNKPERPSSRPDERSGARFCETLRFFPPPLPMTLRRRITTRDVTGVGKVRVMLRVNEDPAGGDSNTFFSVDPRKKQVTLVEPAAGGVGDLSAPEDRRVGVAAPKMFAFDAIFNQDDSQLEVCSSALTDVIHAVINGTDGVLFCFGHARLGKTATMVGSPDSLGVIPCAISWLFRGISEQKQKTGARFSVRVSALEISSSSATSHQLRDLLTGLDNDTDESPGVYLRDDPLFGTQLQNHSELRAPSAEKAAFYLDAAVAARGGNTGREEVKDGHFLYTLHVYQYSMAGKGGVAGGRSRLHLMDLGSCEKGKAGGGIPLSGLGNVLLAIFNGQKHLPYREHKITQVLKECLSSLTCHAAMIAHVSPQAQHYTDTLATIQLASRIHRMRRRKIKFAGTSTGSGGSSGEESRLQTKENGHSTGSSDVDPSSSEQSADTVIYVGRSDEATDGEYPPVYIPSLNSGDNRCAMGKALRGSGVEHKSSLLSSPAKQVHRLPNGNIVSDKGSPSHRNSNMKSSTHQTCPSSNKPPLPAHSISKSSPVRTCKNVPHKTSSSEQTTSSNAHCNKIPVPHGTSNGPVASSSDEQWIDGPRISKSKVAEARSVLKDGGHKKKETWVDGPMQGSKISAGHNAGYGYMDSHKKTMIKKWVENQTSQIQRHSGTEEETRPPTTGALKTELEELRLPSVEHNSELLRTIACEDVYLNMCSNFTEEDVNLNGGITKNNVTVNKLDIETSFFKEEREACEGDHRGSLDMRKEDRDFITKYLMQLNSTNHDDTSTDTLDVTLCFLERIERPLMSACKNKKYILQESVERDDTLAKENSEKTYQDLDIFEEIEHNSSEKTQDICFQVTEEDIALCMAQMENPLSEVGHESAENHPLRILSQENLTVVSTFTDSMSVATDMDRTLPRRQFSHSCLPDHPLHTPRPYSLHELQEHYNNLWLLDGNSTDCETKRRHNGMVDYQDLNSSRSKFDQLSRLHELYKTKLARVNSTRFLDPIQQLKYHRPSRCQSLSLNDMLYGDDCDTHDKTDLNYSGCNGGSSIYSEPAYVFKQQVQSETKICDNCKNNLKPNGTTTNMWHQPFLTGSRDHIFGQTKGIHTSYCGRNGHRFCTRLSNNISSLRHPDGASNPDLKEETKRVPGNGASTSDHEGDLKDRRRRESCEEVRTVTGKENDDEEDDEPPPTLPPPLAAQVASRLHARLFSRSSAHLKPSCLEGYDSTDSSSPRPTKSRQSFPGKLGLQRSAQCQSSGYESFLRDSECSSLASSQDSDTGSTRSAGKLRGDNRTDSSRVPVLQYCREDVERLERRWSEARGGRIKELKDTQQQLKKELAATKRRLLIPSSRWSFELHVETSMDPRNPGFLEALERETQILRKRVEACKSRVLIVTCFDTLANSRQ